MVDRTSKIAADVLLPSPASTSYRPPASTIAATAPPPTYAQPTAGHDQTSGGRSIGRPLSSIPENNPGGIKDAASSPVAADHKLQKTAAPPDLTQIGSAAECPADREWLVYLAFLTLGLGTLLPWNFFITAESYWQYKFRNTTDGLLSVVAPLKNESDTAPPSLPAPRTELQLIYTPVLVCLSQITNFSFLIINAVFSHRLPIRQRLLTTLTAMLVLFAVTTALVKVDSDSWQTGFFALTMVIVVFLNGSGALFQGGLFGLAGMFPPRFMTAVVTGQALGGVFASLARIVSLLAGADDITSAFIFFMIAVAVMMFTMGALYYLCTTEMYHHYTSPSEAEKTEDGTEEERQPFTASQLAAHSSRVFRQIWPLGLSVVCVFWVTLAVFPAVCVKIVSTSTDTEWGGTYFQPVLTFLLFNVGDYVGRQLAGSLMWPKRGSPLVLVMVLLRLVFIPLLLLCNHPGSSSSIPSVFTSDIAYFFIMALFALSNGYCGSICMIYGPMSVSDPKDAERAGSLMAAMLGLGLLLGAATSFGFGMIL